MNSFLGWGGVVGWGGGPGQYVVTPTRVELSWAVTIPKSSFLDCLPAQLIFWLKLGSDNFNVKHVRNHNMPVNCVKEGLSVRINKMVGEHKCC